MANQEISFHDVVGRLFRESEEVARSSEQVARSSEQVARLSERLHTMIGEFGLAVEQSTTFNEVMILNVCNVSFTNPRSIWFKSGKDEKKATRRR